MGFEFVWVPWGTVFFLSFFISRLFFLLLLLCSERTFRWFDFTNQTYFTTISRQKYDTPADDSRRQFWHIWARQIPRVLQILLFFLQKPSHKSVTLNLITFSLHFPLSSAVAFAPSSPRSCSIEQIYHWSESKTQYKIQLINVSIIYALLVDLKHCNRNFRWFVTAFFALSLLLLSLKMLVASICQRGLPNELPISTLSICN